MAQASRVTGAAPNYKRKRKPLTDKQREERSKRTTYKKREQYKQVTSAVRAYHTRGVLREAGTIRRQTIDKQTTAYRQRNLDRNVAAIERRKAYDRQATQQSYKRALVHQPIQQTAAPVAKTGVVLLSVFFLLIIFYTIITHAQGFSGALGSVRNAMATITQTGPLFTKTQTG